MAGALLSGGHGDPKGRSDSRSCFNQVKAWRVYYCVAVPIFRVDGHVSPGDGFLVGKGGGMELALFHSAICVAPKPDGHIRAGSLSTIA
jgi:hypothetical protein